MGRLLTSVALVFLAAFHVVAAPAPAPAVTEAAWREYVRTGTGAEPAAKFPYEHCFQRAAASTGLPVTLLLAVARGESDFDPRARSHANAHGLMQIQWPGTARHLGIHRLSKLYDPCTNVDAGARYLDELLERYRGNLHLALAAYNYGPTRIDASMPAIPDGAAWYSGYILRHLRYVTGPPSTAPKKQRPDYRDDRHDTVITFRRPWRAEAHVRALQARAPALRLSWFRTAGGQFRVVMLYRSDAELQAGRRARGAIGKGST